MTQSERLLRLLREHPEGLSSLEITYALRLVNVTGRISDLRIAGHAVRARREGGIWRYRLQGPSVQLGLDGSTRPVGRE